MKKLTAIALLLSATFSSIAMADTTLTVYTALEADQALLHKSA